MKSSFYLVTFEVCELERTPLLKYFCYTENSGMRRLNSMSFYSELTGCDYVFLDFSSFDINEYFYSPPLCHLLRKLLLNLGVETFLNKVILENFKDSSFYDLPEIFSLNELLDIYLTNVKARDGGFLFRFDGLLSLILFVIFFLRNRRVSVFDFSAPLVTLVDSCHFYKSIMNELIDEKIANNNIGNIGLSQNLVMLRLHELLDRFYQESDAASIHLLLSLSIHFRLREITSKCYTALYFLSGLSPRFADSILDHNENDDLIDVIDKSALRVQNTIRALFAMSCFDFWSPRYPSGFQLLMRKNDHALDFAFSFLDDSLMLLGCENELVKFFYRALEFLNEQKNLLLIQVGAFDGVHGDFIHDFLMKEECEAILIEPQVTAFNQLKENYTGSKSDIRFVNGAIGVKSESVTMFRVKSDFLNYYNRSDETYLGRIASFNKDYVVENIAGKIKRWGDGRVSPDESVQFVESFDVDIVEFENIVNFDEVTENEIVLQIDCEGFDFEVIKCFPLDKKRPSLIHFESDKLVESKSDCFRYLRSIGYMIIEHGVKVPSDTLAIDLNNRSLRKALCVSGFSTSVKTGALSE